MSLASGSAVLIADDMDRGLEISLNSQSRKKLERSLQKIQHQQAPARDKSHKIDHIIDAVYLLAFE